MDFRPRMQRTAFVTSLTKTITMLKRRFASINDCTHLLACAKTSTGVLCLATFATVTVLKKAKERRRIVDIETAQQKKKEEEAAAQAATADAAAAAEQERKQRLVDAAAALAIAEADRRRNRQEEQILAKIRTDFAGRGLFVKHEIEKVGMLVDAGNF